MFLNMILRNGKNGKIDINMDITYLCAFNQNVRKSKY